MRFTLLKKLVSGLAPGTLTIPAMRIRTSLRSAGDPFGDPFGFFRSQPVELASKPLALKILPIPGDSAFNGPVGRFDLTARLDKTRVAVGEAATLRVRLSGPGGLRTATEPPKVTVPGAKVYPPTARTEPPHSGKAGAVEWEYVLVPTAPGEITIPPVSLETFDPAEKRLVARITAPLHLAVESAGAAARRDSRDGGRLSRGSRRDDRSDPAADGRRGRDPDSFRRPRHSTSLQRPSRFPSGSFSPSPAARWRSAESGSSPAAGDRFAPTSGRALDPEPGETKERAAARIDHALRERLARQYGLPDSATTTAALLATLAENQVPDEVRRDTEKLLADLDFLRFAPQLGDYSAKITEVRAEAGRIFQRLF